jgi:hypothetical protein
MYTKENLQEIFVPQNGWELVNLNPSDVDRRATVFGTKIRCIDRRFGVTEDGYNPEAVPLAPAWLGAVDGIEAFLKRNNPLHRTKEAARRVRALGFEPADHGDYALGKDGCAFRRARMAGLVPGVRPALSADLDDFVKEKVGVEHYVLREAKYHARGFIFNTEQNTTVLPEDGRYYVIDEWVARGTGIKPAQFLPVIAACGELMLPEEDRKLFIV